MAMNEENLLSGKESSEEPSSEQAAPNIPRQNPSWVHIPHWESAGLHHQVFLREKQTRLEHRPLQTVKKHKSLTNLKNNTTEPEKLNVLNTQNKGKGTHL